jgi:hypothetical protein
MATYFKEILYKITDKEMGVLLGTMGQSLLVNFRKISSMVTVN